MKGMSEDSQLCAHHGHPAEPGERSEPDIQASAPSDGDGWIAAVQGGAVTRPLCALAAVQPMRLNAQKQT
jgi:hypothetical protein